MKKSYFKRILILITALFNVLILNGSEDHTTSGRVGYKAKTTNKKRWLLAEKVINTIFWFDKDHCRKSIEEDEYIDYPFFGWNVLTIILIIYYIGL